jgi:hypothetical protein
VNAAWIEPFLHTNGVCGKEQPPCSRHAECDGERQVEPAVPLEIDCSEDKKDDSDGADRCRLGHP